MGDNEKRKIKFKTPLPPLSERPPTECAILQRLREEKDARLHNQSGGFRGPIPTKAIRCSPIGGIVSGREHHTGTSK